MEHDGLIIIGVQEAIKYLTTQGTGRDYDEGVEFQCESIVLTTKGKSWFSYLLYKANEENPISTAISVIAIIISLVALSKSS